MPAATDQKRRYGASEEINLEADTKRVCIEEKKYHIMAFDTETNGWVAGEKNKKTIGRVVELGWVVFDDTGNKIESCSHILKPNGYTIAAKAVDYHKITNEKANEEGEEAVEVMKKFLGALEKLKRNDGVLIAHNWKHDYLTCWKEFNILQMQEGINLLDGVRKDDTLHLPYLHAYARKFPTGNTTYLRRTYRGLKLSLMFTLLCADQPDIQYLLQHQHSAEEDAEMCARIYLALQKCAIPLQRYSINTNRIY
jgi:DNA polymerase III epsilon subunit-like protein